MVNLNLNSHMDSVIERRWLTIFLSFLILFGFGAGMQHLKVVDVDFRNHFSKDDPRLIALEELEQTFAVSDSVIVAAAPKSGSIFSQEALSVIDALTEQLWLTPYSTRVDSITNYSHSQGFEDELVVETLVEDASTLSDSDIEHIADIALNTQEVAGRLVSRDGRVAGSIVSFAVPDENRQLAKIEAVDFLTETVNEFRATYPSMDFHMTGELLLNRAVLDALNEDFGILGPISFGTMLLVAVIMLRSVWATIAVVLMLIAVVLSALGFTGWAGFKFYGESGAAVFVLMAVTVAHCVHIIEAVQKNMRRGVERQNAIIEALQFNMWPVFLTSITTAIGFLSLNFSEMPPFRVMGNIVAFGTVCAFFFSVTLLPAALSVMPLRARSPVSEKVEIFDRFGRFVVSNHVTLLWATGIVIVVLLLGIVRIELDDNHLKLLDDRYEFRRSTDFVSENYTGLEPLEYSLTAGRADGVTDSEFLKQVDAFAEWYRKQPEVAHVFGISDIIKRLNTNLNSDNPEFYRIPDDSDLIAQYLLLYEFSLPVGLDLNNLIDVDRSATRLTVVLGNLSTNQKIALDERAHTWLQQNAPDLESRATGVSIVGAYSIKRNIVLMLIATITAMSVVSLLLFFVFKSFKFGLISIIPNFFPAAIAIGLWGYFVGEIGVSAAVVTAIAFGIIVDDTIHFMTNYLRSRRSGMTPSDSVHSTFRKVGKALLTTTVIFGLGFIVFGASGMANNQALGLLMVITVVVALLADFLFLPPLLMILDRTKGEKQTPSG